MNLGEVRGWGRWTVLQPPSPSSVLLDTPLTGFPKALPTWWEASVQPLMPFPEEAVEDTPTAAKDSALHLVDVGAPVLGLGWRRWE